jgi:hypothetical protein
MVGELEHALGRSTDTVGRQQPEHRSSARRLVSAHPDSRRLPIMLNPAALKATAFMT